MEQSEFMVRIPTVERLWVMRLWVMRGIEQGEGRDPKPSSTAKSKDEGNRSQDSPKELLMSPCSELCFQKDQCLCFQRTHPSGRLGIASFLV